MVAEDFLHDPEVRQWLNGIEPAWTLLTFESLQALRQEPSAISQAVRIANDLSTAEISSSAVARNTDREETRPKLTVWPGTAPQEKAPTPVDRIGKLTASELAELAPPEARGVQSGAFSKRFGQAALDWSALRNPTPIPPPPAAEPIHVPSAVQPFYGKLPGASERAELHISDLSLELANPFVGSSLNPPPPPRRRAAGLR